MIEYGGLNMSNSRIDYEREITELKGKIEMWQTQAAFWNKKYEKLKSRTVPDSIEAGDRCDIIANIETDTI